MSPDLVPADLRARPMAPKRDAGLLDFRRRSSPGLLCRAPGAWPGFGPSARLLWRRLSLLAALLMLACGRRRQSHRVGMPSPLFSLSLGDRRTVRTAG